MKIPLINMSRLGEYGLLFQSEGPLSLDIQGRFWALDLQCREIQGVDELVLGMHSLLLCLSPGADPENIRLQVLQQWRSISSMPPNETIVDIPVIYDGEDLIEIADQKSMTVEDIVRLHTHAEYTVFALGSQPGFPYLGGLDERLAVPRRSEPRVRVEAGSVVIGGTQTGVISRTSPSGWHIIGHTQTELFDINKARPALLSPGDRIRFVTATVDK
ncbi:Kinase A inhibitor [Granulosicoccus antarcticus IMCC3135]|uniref:Kinase A inhibitor n=2 Tax=Granulosicoccus TaxID=437504 RepID=A0A2Z2NQI2_9GAMM|nr:Kinase A inhibitor [Granulosicoccus antarcticus IMCC3135]